VRPRLTAPAANRGALPVLAVLVAVGLAACGSNAVAAPSRDGHVAYVATGAGLADPGNTLAVVDTASGALLHPVMTGTRASTTASLPTSLAATPDGHDVLVADKGVDVLSMIDAATGAEVGRATVGLEPDAVAVSPNGSLALVANLLDGTVTPVSLPSLHAGTPLRVGTHPDAVAISPNGSLALVANFGDGTVTPISLPSLVAGAPVAVGLEPDAVAFSPNGTIALVADQQTSTVVPLAVPSLTVGAPIAVGGDPTGIAVDPAAGTAGTAYVSAGDGVTPIALAGLVAGTPVPIGTGADAIAVGPGDRHAWVCGQAGTLVELALPGGTVVRRVAVGGEPVAVVVPPPRAPTG
jgi:hyaluronoglucosaminidase